MTEAYFQRGIINKLKHTFEGCIVLKTDPAYIQGFPDLLVFYKDKWAALEVKRSSTAAVRPNQIYYVDLCDSMSFARFVNPGNVEQVLCELSEHFA